MENTIISKKIKTPLGEMIAFVFDNRLILFEFTDRKMYDNQIKSIKKQIKAKIIFGNNRLTDLLIRQTDEFFSGKRKKIDIPLFFTGTEFQKKVWEELLKIPYGKTVSYSDIANRIEKPKAVRAVAGAIGANKIAIAVPCHRVVGKDKTLTGYAGGLERKKFLLNLEKSYFLQI